MGDGQTDIERKHDAGPGPGTPVPAQFLCIQLFLPYAFMEHLLCPSHLKRHIPQKTQTDGQLPFIPRDCVTHHGACSSPVEGFLPCRTRRHVGLFSCLSARGRARAHTHTEIFSENLSSPRHYPGRGWSNGKSLPLGLWRWQIFRSWRFRC